MKKLLILSLTTIILLSLSANHSFAGSKQRHRWEGVAIALGAAMLGSAILDSCPPPERVAIRHEPHYRSYPPSRPYHGYYETRKVWAPPVCKRVWNPAHYECGRWVQGQYIDIEVEPGYWREERVWSCR